jgi:hypothetical protein
MDVLIFAKQVTNRLKYVTDFIFKSQFSVDVTLTENWDFFIFQNAKMKVNFSTNEAIKGVFQMKPACNILFETDLKFENIDILEKYIQNTQFLPFGEIKGGLILGGGHFDCFSTTFLLLSRYEEYFSEIPKDEHGRFTAKQSLASRLNILQKPIIDIWIQAFAKYLLEQNIDIQQKKYRFQPTFDIDMAWQVKNKGFMRTSLSLAKNFLTFRFKKVIKTIRILGGGLSDPDFTFDYIFELERKHQLKTIFFWLVADYAKYDTNTPTKNKAFQNLILKIVKTNRIGIHPSYASNLDIKILAKEKLRLESISQQKIIRSRQHFLKLYFPQTYQNLLQQNIVSDYSMGFSDDVGFRAGTSQSFFWFDLSKNESTQLKIFPFAAMDVTLKNYLKLSPEAAIETLENLKNEVQKVNGTFTTLWHNSSLSESDDWKNWRNVYEKIVENATKT